MDFSTITVREDTTVKAILPYCRHLGKLPEHCHYIYVVNCDNQLKDCIPLDQLITFAFGKSAAQVMTQNLIKFLTNDSAQEAANAFERFDLTSAPVVDNKNRLIGRICVNDIIDIIRESAEEQMFCQLGFIEGEDKFSGIWTGAKNRWLWLAINLISAYFATRVISVFWSS